MELQTIVIERRVFTMSCDYCSITLYILESMFSCYKSAYFIMHKMYLAEFIRNSDLLASPSISNPEGLG